MIVKKPEKILIASLGLVPILSSPASSISRNWNINGKHLSIDTEASIRIGILLQTWALFSSQFYEFQVSWRIKCSTKMRDIEHIAGLISLIKEIRQNAFQSGKRYK